MKAIISTMTTTAISFLLFFRIHFIKFIVALRSPDLFGSYCDSSRL